MLLVATILGAIGLAAVATQRPVEAAFPGKNGFIAFTGHPDGPDGDSEVLKIRPDGSGLKQITHNTVDDYEPAWSPDGSKIAFRRGYRDPAKESAIFVKNITAGGTVQLSDPNDSMDD